MILVDTTVTVLRILQKLEVGLEGYGMKKMWDNQSYESKINDEEDMSIEISIGIHSVTNMIY